MKSHKAYSYTSITFFIISISINAQSLSLGDDRKRFLLEEIKPPQTQSKPIFEQSKSESKTINDDDLLSISKRYKSGGSEFDGKYDTIAFKSKLNADDLLKTDAYTETKTIINGGRVYQSPVTEVNRQLDKLSQRHRLQGIILNVTMGGLNLSGWKKRKLSKKSKAILKEIYEIEINEE